MNGPSTNPTKENAPLERGSFGATGQKHNADHNAEKALATIRAKLCIAGGFLLHRSLKDDGTTTYLVVSPWGHTREFVSLSDIETAFSRWPA